MLVWMKLTKVQYERIADCLPRQWGNVSMTNLQLLNALFYMVEHGCKMAWATQTLWQLAYQFTRG